MPDILNKEKILTEGTPNSGATKTAQILLRRKTISQWESNAQTIPIGEPCFAYDAETGDFLLKIGAPNSDGDAQIWNALNLLRGRVDDGELN